MGKFDGASLGTWLRTHYLGIEKDRGATRAEHLRAIKPTTKRTLNHCAAVTVQCSLLDSSKFYG